MPERRMRSLHAGLLVCIACVLCLAPGATANEPPTRNATAVAAQAQSDGKVVVLATTPGRTGARVLRLNKSGSLDRTFFHGAGYRDLKTPTVPTGLALQGSVIVIYGAQYSCDGCNPAPGSAVAIRLKRNGTTDTRFGDSGRTRLLVFGNNLGGTGRVAVDARGHLLFLVSLEQCDSTRNCTSTSYLIRTGPRGTRDSSFGASGIAQIPLTEAIPTSLVALGDGTTLVGGSVLNSVPPAGFVSSLTTNGMPNGAFGSVSGTVSLPDAVDSLSASSNGAIYAAGISAGALSVTRLTPTGTVDSTYGSAGAFRTPLGSSGDAIADVQALRDGSLLTVASTFVNCSSTLCRSGAILDRVTRSGELDDTFGSAGTSVGLRGSADASPSAPPPAAFLVNARGGYAVAGTRLISHVPYVSVRLITARDGFSLTP